MTNNSKSTDLKKKENPEDNSTAQPDPETVGKTDPQENMKGPVSSLVNKTKDQMEENDDKDAVDETEFEEDVDDEEEEER